jgi:uncharacterized membrane protein
MTHQLSQHLNSKGENICDENKIVKVMSKFKIITFFTLFLAVLVGTIVFNRNDWNSEFMAFFFFAAGFAAQAANELYKHLNSTFEHEAEEANSWARIVVLALYIPTCMFIGVMHILGNLDFPEFVIMGGWGNVYVIATRIAWLLISFVTIFLLGSFNIDRKNTEAIRKPSREGRKKFRFPRILLKSLIYPPISVPLFVLLTDLSGLKFVSQFLIGLLHT